MQHFVANSSDILSDAISLVEDGVYKTPENISMFLLVGEKDALPLGNPMEVIANAEFAREYADRYYE